jgi:hypothetical protein
MSAGPRRARRGATTVLAVCLSLVAAACGVAADDAAARVGDRVVTTTDVDALATDEEFVGLVVGQQAPPAGSVVLPGDVVRPVLLFEIQRVGLLAELERWGVDLPADTLDEARQQVSAQLAGTGSDASGDVVERLAEFIAARQALQERLSRIDPTSDQDLRALYDGAPALWDRVCIDVVQVPNEQVGRAGDIVERGGSVDDLVDDIEDAQVLADPGQGCVAREQLPGELRSEVEVAPTGRVRGPVLVGGDGGFAVVFRVRETQRLSFDDAREELAQLAEGFGAQGAGTWLGLSLLGRVEINPRYGSRIEPDPATGQLAIAPPDAPLTPLVPSPLLGG